MIRVTLTVAGIFSLEKNDDDDGRTKIPQNRKISIPVPKIRTIYQDGIYPDLELQ